MRYGNIVKGCFIERKNRFIALAEVEGVIETVHVKNTGRCKEILVSGAVVYLERCDNPARKTKYDLVAAEKGDRLVNIDSQLPNALVEEWLSDQNIISGLTYVKRERTFGGSRFDFYMEAGERRIFMEVKGCTLERNGIASFPDAPTERGVKHLRELAEACVQGYEAYIFFVIQMRGVNYFTPADDIHGDFGDALREAAAAGVQVLAFDCEVTPDTVHICRPVRIRLHGDYK